MLNKEAYYESIINTTVELGTAEEFIVVLSELIQRLAVDHLHVLGDIYDRGAGPHLIMDRLCRYHSLDIQWAITILSGWGSSRKSCMYCNCCQKQYQIW